MSTVKLGKMALTCLHIYNGRPAGTTQTERVYIASQIKETKYTYAEIT
jgi:hypothetical protein